MKDPSKNCNTLVVMRARFPVYIDENRPALVVPEPSDRVCASICRDFAIGIMGYEPGRAEPGLTWVQGEYGPSVVEKMMAPQMATLRERQNEWFKNLVVIADDDWSKLHMRRAISGLQRVACRCLGLEREWNIDIEIEKQVDIDMTPCKFCRAPVHHEEFISAQTLVGQAKSPQVKDSLSEQFGR